MVGEDLASVEGEMKNRETLVGGMRATGEPMVGTMGLEGEGREGAGEKIGGEVVGRRRTGG